jgi:hypothetical protein
MVVWRYRPAPDHFPHQNLGFFILTYDVSCYISLVLSMCPSQAKRPTWTIQQQVCPNLRESPRRGPQKPSRPSLGPGSPALSKSLTSRSQSKPISPSPAPTYMYFVHSTNMWRVRRCLFMGATLVFECAPAINVTTFLCALATVNLSSYCSVCVCFFC